MRKNSILGAALLASLLAGCNVELGESSEGELGVVEFSYTSDCFFGCSLDNAVAPAATMRISMSNPGDASGITAISSEPSIATFAIERSCVCSWSSNNEGAGAVVAEDASCAPGWTKECHNTVVMSALVAGDSALELRDESGEIVDRVLVHVRSPTAAAFTMASDSDSVEVTSIELVASESQLVRVCLTDEDGIRVLAPNAVQWFAADSAVAGFPVWLSLSGDPVESAVVSGEYATLEGVSAGATLLHIRQGSFETAIPIIVLPE